MEAEADSPTRSGRARKRARRKRAYTRKASLSTSLIDMAEARREIFTALQLHRSTSVRNPALPSPEPAWSAAPVELLEVEWFDNVSASCAWWMGFLSSLDRKSGRDEPAAEGSGAGPAPCLSLGKPGLDGGDPNPFTDEWVVFPPVEESGGNVE